MARKTKEAQEQASQALPSRPEMPDNNTLIETGFEAQEFERSEDGGYWHDMLDRMIHARMWEKLNLYTGQEARLAQLCTEIDLLNEIKGMPNRDVNMGTAAQAREANRNG